MNILFYTMLFIVGIVVGSLWDIKTKEIPKSLDMRKKHYSNTSNGELISKLTYIIIGGVSSVILANILKINIHEFDISKLIIYVFTMLYISTLILIAGIDRNYCKVEKRIIAFGIISSIIYMIYLFVVDLASVYLNLVFLVTYIGLLIIDTFLLRKYAKDSYILNILLLLNIILVFTDFKILIYTLVMALVSTILYILLLEVNKKKNGNKKIKIDEIPVGFFISASNIIVLYMVGFFQNYFI